MDVADDGSLALSDTARNLPKILRRIRVGCPKLEHLAMVSTVAPWDAFEPDLDDPFQFDFPFRLPMELFQFRGLKSFDYKYQFMAESFRTEFEEHLKFLMLDSHLGHPNIFLGSQNGNNFELSWDDQVRSYFRDVSSGYENSYSEGLNASFVAYVNGLVTLQPDDDLEARIDEPPFPAFAPEEKKQKKREEKKEKKKEETENGNGGEAGDDEGGEKAEEETDEEGHEFHHDMKPWLQNMCNVILEGCLEYNLDSQ